MSGWHNLLHWPSSPEWASAYSLEAQIKKIGPLFYRTTFKLTGPVHELLFPKESSLRSRNQKLWEHSCFELFIGLPESSEYFEWNFSPSGEWGHFRFSDYRQPYPEQERLSGGVEEISFQKQTSGLELKAFVRVSEIESIAWSQANKLKTPAAMTAILENKRNEKTFWASRHCREKPDFHARESFVVNCP